MIHRPTRHLESFSCNLQVLNSLVNDQLDDDRTQWLSMHLDQCESCRQQLTQLSFGGTDWGETRTVILEETERKSRSVTMPIPSHVIPKDRMTSLVRWLDPVAEAPPAQNEYIGQVGDYLVKRAIGHGGMGDPPFVLSQRGVSSAGLKRTHPDPFRNPDLRSPNRSNLSCIGFLKRGGRSGLSRRLSWPMTCANCWRTARIGANTLSQRDSLSDSPPSTPRWHRIADGSLSSVWSQRSW